MLASRGYYTFQAGDETITIRFCTYSIKRFCERNGNLSLQSFFELLQKELTLSQFIDLLWCAGEAYAIETKKEYTVTDFEVSNWFDHIGGFGSDGFQQIIKVLVDSQIPPKEPKAKNVKSR